MRTRQASDRIDVVVVGAGQAGLAVSYYLQAFGVEHVVLERDRIAESWRSQRWDSFTLVTPNWMTRLPGHAMAPGSGRDFLPLRQVVDMLERFGRGLPVRTGVGVTSVTLADRGYRVITTTGHIAAQVVVIASGGQRRPVIPVLGPDSGWLRVPVLRPDGSPAHTRGITACPGLYVAGFPWLSNRGSGILYGAAADAARIAQHIAALAGGDRAGRPDLRPTELQSTGAQP